MHSSCFVFPLAGFVKQIARSIFESSKTLGTIEDLEPSMHANMRHSQAAAAHNCATGMAVDLFRRMVQTRCEGREINLQKAVALRRFIAERHSCLCEEHLRRSNPV